MKRAIRYLLLVGIAAVWFVTRSLFAREYCPLTVEVVAPNGKRPEAADVLAKAPEVQLKENDPSSALETLRIAPVSITVYRFAVATVAARPQIKPGMTAPSVPEQGK